MASVLCQKPRRHRHVVSGHTESHDETYCLRAANGTSSSSAPACVQGCAGIVGCASVVANHGPTSVSAVSHGDYGWTILGGACTSASARI